MANVHTTDLGESLVRKRKDPGGDFKRPGLRYLSSSIKPQYLVRIFDDLKYVLYVQVELKSVKSLKVRVSTVGPLLVGRRVTEGREGGRGSHKTSRSVLVNT